MHFGVVAMRISQPATVVTLDVESELAIIHLVALACWPRDQRKRGEALVTWAAQIMGLLQAGGYTSEGIDSLLQKSAVEAAARMGITVETLLTLPHAREVVSQARTIPSMLQNLVMTNLFNPGGGWLTTGTAAMQGRVGHQFDAANRSGLVAGLVVLHCATISKHHPEMTASYNRAMHLVQTQHAKGQI